jgi:isopenicillin N synthase-like dioxygenase
MPKQLIEVPVLDMRCLQEGEQERTQFVSDLGEAIDQLGFCRLVNHGVSRDSIQSAYSYMQNLFNLPVEQKMTMFSEAAKGNRGYIPFGMEKAKDAGIPDLKEFYHVGQDITSDHRFYNEYGPNLWPSEALSADLRDFRLDVSALYKSFEHCGKNILSCLASHLGLDSDFFNPIVTDGNSILRMIHYPPIGMHNAQVKSGAVRAAAHEDINLLTLLPSATDGGLQILRRSDNKWIDVSEGPDELIIDTGDMFERLTGGVVRATTHRVMNPSVERDPSAFERPRYSMPFFMHPHPEAWLDSSCLPAHIQQPKRQAPIKAGDFLNQRLREIGVLK